jgi:hypothetical protein
VTATLDFVLSSSDDGRILAYSVADGAHPLGLLRGEAVQDN